MYQINLRNLNIGKPEYLKLRFSDPLISSDLSGLSDLVDPSGLEPLTSSLQMMRSTR